MFANGEVDPKSVEDTRDGATNTPDTAHAVGTTDDAHDAETDTCADGTQDEHPAHSTAKTRQPARPAAR